MLFEHGIEMSRFYNALKQFTVWTHIRVLKQFTFLARHRDEQLLYCFKTFYFQFEHGIEINRFLEHGEYDGNYYGTKFDSIRATIKSGKICILDLNPQVRMRHGSFHTAFLSKDILAGNANNGTPSKIASMQENKPVGLYWQTPPYLQDVDWLLYTPHHPLLRSHLVLPGPTVDADVQYQGSHSDWKTWENGKAFSSQGKVREFWTDWKSQGKPHKILENWDKLR